jgi:hypothetical protein
MRTVLVHFDVDEDYVLLETFVASANAAARSVRAINQELFQGQMVLEIVVFPPAPGSVKQYIGVTVKLVRNATVGALTVYGFLWSLIQLMDSPTVQDVTEELLGSKPSELLIDKIRDIRERSQSDDRSEEEIQSLHEEAVGLAEEVLVESAANALSGPPERLDAQEFPSELGYELRLAQSELFSAVLEDRNVRALSFREDDPNPVPRNQFAQRGVRPLPPRKEEEQEEWQVTLQQIRITSPVFEKDEPQRKWMGRDTKGSTILFDVVDADFWNRLVRSEVKFSEGSEILAQVATRVGKRGPRERKVLRVLRLDGLNLAEPLDENATLSILGSIKSDQKDDGQGGLF